jgi:dolichol-phosphate mannosyltransferase
MNNEENNIEKFLFNIDKIMQEKFEAYEFVLVNDFCKDNTIKKITEITDDIYGDIQIVNMAWKHGIELAMLAGIDISIGDYVYEFDYTTIDYDIEVVFDLYGKCISGFDVVSASPQERYKYINKLFYNYLSKISYRKMKLDTETFRIVSRRCLNRVLDFKETVVYRKALYHYSGLSTSIIYYKTQNNNNTRKSNFSIGEKFELAIDILINFSNIGIRVTSKLSFIFFIISVLAGIYTVNSYLTDKPIQPGWTTIMLFLSISFTGMFFILTLLSKYMIIVLEGLQDRPKYVYKSIDRISKK